MASTPAPPLFVTIATRPRCIGRKRETVSAAAKSSERPCTRRIPARCSAAAITASAPESRPVWVSAAAAACGEPPALSAITGFSRAVARAADRNRRGSGMLSM